MDELSTDEQVSASVEFSPGRIEGNPRNGSIETVEVRRQRSNDLAVFHPAHIKALPFSVGRLDVRAARAAIQTTRTGDDTSSDWCSIPAIPSYRRNRFYAGTERPLDAPPSTHVWTITPKAWFSRGNNQNEDITDLCEQCSQIDFKAIFNVHPDQISGTEERVCSFLGLSRSMLTSECPSCRVLAKIVYTEFWESDEIDPNRGQNTFVGHLVSVSSADLGGNGVQPKVFASQPRILKVEVLRGSVPWSHVAWEELHNTHHSPSTSLGLIWEYVRARDAILPATTIESAHIDFKDLRAAKRFCYGIPLGGRVDYHRISTMLHRCQKLHPECGTDVELRFPQNARIIDCVTRRVVPMSDGLQYIALSYVWGTRRDADGSTPVPNTGTSGCLPPVLPQLIEDALNVTIRLRYQHLWIDFFCIDQDHSAAKAAQIQQMANIYSHASATICALGASPDVGLPGVSQSRPVSASFRSQDVTYMHVSDPKFLQLALENSTWIRRGWTFQEAILSQRCLFFTDEQVSLVCHKSHQTESISQLSTNWLWGTNANIFTTILRTDDSGPATFEQFVNHFQGRSLSYQADALDAFKGLLSLAPTQSFYGILLPQPVLGRADISVSFVFGLLWQVVHNDDCSQRLRANFPSWSWVSRENTTIDTTIIGKSEIPKKDLRHKRLSRPALCIWMENSVNIRTATIFVDNSDGNPILVEDLFHKYRHMKVIPEEAAALRLDSFVATYRISKFDPDRWERSHVEVDMETSNNLPFEWPAMERDSWRYAYSVNYLYDDVSFMNDTREDSRLAILLMDNRASCFGIVSYWLALRPAYEDKGRRFFYREGIIRIRGALKWKHDWESAPRDTIWLI